MISKSFSVLLKCVAKFRKNKQKLPPASGSSFSGKEKEENRTQNIFSW
jgi:hypothetical protein